MRIAQLTDTHVVEAGYLCHGLDTGAYLSGAIRALNAMTPPVDQTIVTGDLVDAGRPAQYAHFNERMSELTSPWIVAAGNHDRVESLRGALPPRVFGAAPGPDLTYVLDLGEVRIVALDVNLKGPSPGAELEDANAKWLEETLAASTQPTLLAVHQPPFSSGLWYLDIFGFRGARRMREIVDRYPQVGRVISGHIHCVRSATWKYAVACTAPSSAPQFVPIFHKLEVSMQEPGFAIHDFTSGRWTTTIYRRSAGDFEETERFADGVRA